MGVIGFKQNILECAVKRGTTRTENPIVRGACWGVQVRARDDMGAISFGTDILKRAVKSRDDQELLMDALSLMGYTDATKAPCGQMMGQQVRPCAPHRLRRTS